MIAAGINPVLRCSGGSSVYTAHLACVVLILALPYFILE